MPRRSTSLSLSAIRDALSAHRGRSSNLKAKLAAIERALADAQADLAAIEGNGIVTRRRGRRAAAAATKAPRARGRRARGGMGRRAKGQDLASTLVKVLKDAGKPMAIPAIVVAAKKAGYATSSASFPRIVGMRLGNKKLFKRTGRGVYTEA